MKIANSACPTESLNVARLVTIACESKFFRKHLSELYTLPDLHIKPLGVLLYFPTDNMTLGSQVSPNITLRACDT